MIATQKDKQFLNQLYAGRQPFHGELHDHSASGGTSDGKRPLSHWRGALEALHMDFAAILDHRQVRHMYLPEWEDGLFIGGSEPGTRISDSAAPNASLHYNMLFENAKPLEELLAAFPEYAFEGGSEGHFRYPEFTTERFGELIDAVKARGGFFVLPHPKQIMVSDDPNTYWFRDETGIEVFYIAPESQATVDNYALWTQLLSLGKRVWACAGGDLHACAHKDALTTIYAEEKRNASYLSHLRVGDFTCGAVGIRMAVGNVEASSSATLMGGKCAFAGKRLVLSVGDFHDSVRDPVHHYRVELLTEKGKVFSEKISCEETSYFAIAAPQDCRFCRAEVFDESRELRIAIGNPIWNRE